MRSVKIKKLFSFILVAALVVGLFPAAAFAQETEGTGEIPDNIIIEDSSLEDDIALMSEQEEPEKIEEKMIQTAASFLSRQLEE